jgi:DNA repair exonuclease SbcCD ATPase subunit
MAIPLVVQGLIEEDGKVFELDSPKASAWLEEIGSFRFEPSSGHKACTVRREPSGYWYGCRKVAGKVRKKYIGKTSEVSTAKLEEIAEALEIPPVPRVNKVAEVAQEVTQVAQDRLAALELDVANLRKALEALQEALPGKSEAGDSEELPKVDSEVAEELQNDLSNLKAENEYLRQKLAESRNTIETLNWGTEALNDQLKVAQAENQRLQKGLGNLQAQREDLAQLKKQVKEHAHELHLEENSMKLEKVRWQRELSDARAELADAKVTMLNQGNKIRELERGFSFKPNPAERRLRLEIGELQAELTDLKQKSATTRELPEAADLLNQLKARRKKSTVSLADVELILEMIEES